MQVRKTSGLEEVMSVSDRLPNIVTLSVLIHYHITCEPWSRRNLVTAATNAAEDWLAKHDLIAWSDGFGCYTTSPKGAALMRHIISTPLPVAHTTWKVPHREAAE